MSAFHRPTFPSLVSVLGFAVIAWTLSIVSLMSSWSALSSLRCISLRILSALPNPGWFRMSEETPKAWSSKLSVVWFWKKSFFQGSIIWCKEWGQNIFLEKNPFQGVKIWSLQSQEPHYTGCWLCVDFQHNLTSSARPVPRVVYTPCNAHRQPTLQNC